MERLIDRRTRNQAIPFLTHRIKPMLVSDDFKLKIGRV